MKTTMRTVELAAAMVALAVFGLGLPASAQELVHPATKNEPGQLSVEAALAKTEIGYGVSVDRSLAGLNLALGLSPALDLIGSVGLITDTEIATPRVRVSGLSADDYAGDGMLFAAGVRMKFIENNHVSLFGYGLVRHTTEDFDRTIRYSVYGVSGRVDQEASLDTTEVILGGGLNYAVNDRFDVYGSLSLIPISEVSIDENTSHDFGGVQQSGSIGADFDRADLYQARIGAQYDLGRYWVRGDLSLFGEETIMVAGGMAF